jgi:signal transduction histidine kinase/CheY-like chemotaxis protein
VAFEKPIVNLLQQEKKQTMPNFFSFLEARCRIAIRNKSKRYLLLALVSVCTVANSQQTIVDSLQERLLKEKEPKARIEILNELHSQTYPNNPRQSLVYPLEVIGLAVANNNNVEISKAYQKMGMSYVFLNELDSALHFLSKAREIAELHHDLTNIGTSLRTLGTVYWYKNDINKAIEFYSESVQIFEKLGDEQQKATSISNLGTAYYVLGDFSKSIDFYSKALETIDSAKYASETASYLNDVGTIFKEWGNRTKALEYFLRALKINNMINNKRYKATNLDNIASIYAEEGDYTIALQYIHQALAIEKEIDNVYGMATSFQTISSFHQKNSQIDSSLHYLRNALKCYDFVGDKLGLANTYSNYGEAYLLKKEYDKSLSYFVLAKDIAQSIDNEKGIAYALGGIGKAHFYLGNLNSAIVTFEKSVMLAEKHNYTPLLLSNYRYLAKAHKKRGNRGDEANYLEKLLSVKDTVYQQEKQKQASELLARFESERKESEIQLLNQRNLIARNQLARQRTTIAVVVIVLIFSIVGVFLLFRRYREKKRINQLLENKNREIEEKQREIERQNRTLEEQAYKLRELDEIKTRFFTNISHEFRTPLTLIIGPVEQLLSKPLENESEATLKRVLNNAQNLLGLINQLLEISKIEKGMVKMQFAKGNISRQLQFITEMFSNAAAEKKLDMQFHPKGNNFTGYFDKGKMERILFNLLSNALKNTDKGEIRVILEHSVQKGFVKISVSDTGCGIEKEKVPFIFDRFYSTGITPEGRKASSGIGLAYTRELIKIYRGTVDVVSEVDEGSTFTIELPCTLDCFDKHEYELVDYSECETEVLNPKTTVPVAKAAGHENISREQETILLVEDHDELRRFIASNLVENYRVLEAENGRVGIDLALKERPHLIITDVMMPEVDGMELAKTLKNNEETSHIPIIMLTAKASEESRIAGLETQVDDYLTKPFSYRELSVRIKNLLTIRAKLREKYHRSITVNPSEVTTNSIDEQFLSKLLRIVEENMADTDFSVESLCDLAGTSRTALHNKLKSLLDQSATEFINSIRMKRAAHLLKSRSGTISEVAYTVGFNNLSYFNRLFKKCFGQTPSEFVD